MILTAFDAYIDAEIDARKKLCLQKFHNWYEKNLSTA